MKTLLILLLIPAICFGQQVKERIGWRTYAYHVTGTIYKVKEVTEYDKLGNLLKTYIDSKDNFEEECKYDNQNRLIYKVEYNDYGEPSSIVEYKFYKHNKYYKKFGFSGGGEQCLAYCYLNEKGQVVEEKEFEIDCSKKGACSDEQKWNAVGKLSKWIIKTYNEDGLLLGERYKEAKEGELSKVLYQYKKGTGLLAKVERYYWENKKESLKTDKEIIYVYDKLNRLTKKHDKSNEDIETYNYKNGQLWIKESKLPTSAAKSIYKDGNLVVLRVFWTNSGRDLNGVKDLMAETYYEYTYWD